MCKKIVAVFLVILFFKNSKAQSSSHVGLFPTIDHSGTLSKKVDYSFYYFGAFNLVNSKILGVKDKSNFFAFYAEQALTYKVNPHLSFTASYVYERQHPFAKNFRNENRFYLQSTYQYELNRTDVKHRLRYDGRFIEDQITGDAPFTSRLRYLFGVKTPLKKLSERIYFTAYNEFFFNLNKSATAIYGENWASAALGFKIGKSSAIEAGPLYIFWMADKQNNLNNFYYLQISWVTHLDFSTPKK